MRGLLFAFLGSAVIAAASCSVYDSSLYQSRATNGGGNHSGGSGNGGGGGGNAADASVGGTGNSPAYCGAPQKATYPDPNPGDPEPSKNVEIVAAQYTIDLGDSPKAATEPTRYLQIGFDLDDTCTLASAPKAGKCLAPPYGVGVIDGKGGIDNALGSLIQTVRDQIDNFSSENYSLRLQAGKSNVMLHVENWNGQANDDQVIVSTMVAAPFDSFGPAGIKPKWQGDDAWPIASDSVNGDSVKTPRFLDKSAYVSNYQLVATLADADLRLDVGLTSVQDVKLDMKLSGAYVVCTIVPTEEGKWGYTMAECTLGGRWLADSLVQQLGQFPNPVANNIPLCKGNSAYVAFKAGICQKTDMFHGTSTPTTHCDSLSIGISYKMKPALLGSVFHLKPVPDPCCQPPCVPGSADDYAHNPKYDCCESIGVPDAGMFAACGITPPDFDAGPSGSGGAGTGGAGSGGASTGGRGGTGGANSGGGGASGGGTDGGSKDASING